MSNVSDDSAMPTLTTDELNDFSDAVDNILAKHWPTPGEAMAAADDSAVQTGLWRAAAAQGWTDLAAEEALDAVARGMQRIGRAACCFPLMDVYIASSIFAGDNVVRARISDGAIRPVVVSGPSSARRLRCVDGALVATHVVVLSDTDAVLTPIETRSRITGLARPDWCDLTAAEQVTATSALPAATVDRYRAMMRLGLVARAVGAAERTLELSVLYAQQRRAFGQRIGGFQAVSHRAADGAIELTAAKYVIAEAVSALKAQRHDAVLTSELAVEFGRHAAVEAQFGAQHTLAASGYFEEHEAPWLFRRLHADVASLDNHGLICGSVADMMLDGGLDMPALNLGEAAEEFRHEVRNFLAPFVADAHITGFGGEASKTYVEEAVQRGYITMAWPAEFGGSDASVEEQIVMAEELAYHRLPLMAKTTADLLGTAVIRHGTRDQQDRILPLIRSAALHVLSGLFRARSRFGSGQAGVVRSARR